MKRPFLLLFAITFVFPCVLIQTLAHGGQTDSQGGHWDHSTGEYHYHHGYPAHQHENGECLYDFDDKTGENSGEPSTNHQSEKPNHDYEADSKEKNDNSKNDSSKNTIIGDVLAMIVVGFIGLFYLMLLVAPVIAWVVEKIKRVLEIISKKKKD